MFFFIKRDFNPVYGIDYEGEEAENEEPRPDSLYQPYDYMGWKTKKAPCSPIASSRPIQSIDYEGEEAENEDPWPNSLHGVKY